MCVDVDSEQKHNKSNSQSNIYRFTMEIQAFS